LRPAIVDSWLRSLATGLDPTELMVPIEADAEQARERWLEHPLGSLEHVIAAQLRAIAEESQSLVVVTDASGLLLHIDGSDRLKERAREMNFLEGARLSEAVDGTNGIGTALAADHALQVFAFEHFNQRHHQWICSAAPVHDPVSGRAVGLIDLSSLWKNAHPRSLALVTSVATRIEHCLLDARRDRDARLRRRYSDLMTRSTDLLVDRDGYLLDGAEPARSTRFEIREGGGEVVLGDGSVAVAEPLGQGEAYLLRPDPPPHAKSRSVEGFERAEVRARELAAEQAALREVATLVASEASPQQVFAVVAKQAARIINVPLVRLIRYEKDGSEAELIGGWGESVDPLAIGTLWQLDGPGVLPSVWHTGRPARLDDYTGLPGQAAAVVRHAGMHSAVASPITVEGRLWGAIAVLSPRQEPLPEDTETRLADFTELVATAIANAESRVAISRLVDEQAALRRVATLVAQQPSPQEVFTAVTEAVGPLLGADMAALHVFPGDGTATTIAGWSATSEILPIGTRLPLDGDSVAARIFHTGSAARMDTYVGAGGETAEVARGLRLRSTVGAPILVEGRVWGALMAATRGAEPFNDDAEARIAAFTQLVATAVSNAQAREDLQRLADEQAALRRVATLVAQAVPPAEIFSAVSKEVGRLFGSDRAAVARFDADGRSLVVVGFSSAMEEVPLGSRYELEDRMAAAAVYRTGRAARVESADWSGATTPLGELARRLGSLSSVASPIVVDGRLWGSIIIATGTEPLPSDTAPRLERFTELVASAIANSNSRAELAASEARARALAEEQTALRRVATLVAQGASPDELFSAVAEEVGAIIDLPIVRVNRFEADGTFTMVGIAGQTNFTVGSRWPVPEDGIAGMILTTGRPARKDDYSTTRGRLGDALREHRTTSTVGVPIVVEGSIWGFMVAAGRPGSAIPRDTEARLARFTELVATAVSNATTRTDLITSRARLVSAADETRRRLERDLHDGIQQWLVALALRARKAAALPAAGEPARQELSGLADDLVAVTDELREISRGIHPAILSDAGLDDALEALARRSAIRVDLDVHFHGRYDPTLEATVYYVVAESITNAVKHAQASTVEVRGGEQEDKLELEIEDNGVGGADPRRGTGMIGLKDRVETLGGTISFASPAGAGTMIRVSLSANPPDEDDLLLRGSDEAISAPTSG
jgi:GAF domain-containing protein